MKTLYLLRHAKAEPGGKETGDPDRVLSPRGREACAVIGAYMRRKHYAPALVLCSTSARTRETLERVADAVGEEMKVQFEDRLYLAAAEDILSMAQKVQDSVSSVMVVGHNPGMHHLSLLLCRPEPTRLRTTLELKYPTGALAVLRFKIKHWHELGLGEGELADFTTPGAL